MPVETIFRRRLVNALQKALRDGHLLLAAPPGYGKTLLLQQLTASQPDTYYLLLTAADSDTAVLQARLQPYQQPGYTLLLDDIHHLAGSETAVNWLAQQLAHGDNRYVISGRYLPQGLDHLLATGQAILWDERDLLFDPTECRLLLAASASQDGAWATWHEQLAGWPLGLGLVARLPATGHTPKLARQQLFAYLAHELFNHLPAELVRFLRVTAVPLAFNDELAAHLLHNDSAADLRQMAQQRNLFLYPDERPGHFRYHDLIRDYLLSQSGEELPDLWQKTIGWFEAQGDLPQAIEHALAAGWQDEAARLINLVSPDYIYESDRYLTYKRWGEALDEQTRRQHPQILYNLGDFLFFLEDHAEIARRYMRAALAASQAQGDRGLTLMARWRLVFFELDENEATEADLHELAELSAEPDVTLYASQTYAMALADQGRFAQAAVILQRAIQLAEAQQEWERVWRMRAFRALSTLLPMGRFSEASDQFAGTLHYFASEPGRQYTTYQTKNELHFASAAWPALTTNLAAIDELEQQLEIPAVYNLTWISYYRGLRATGVGDFTAAAEHLAAMAGSFNEGDRRCEIPLTRARCWLLRRQGKLAEALALAEAELGQQPPVFPHYRALLALEHDIAAGLLFLEGQRPYFSLRPETTSLIEMRARPDLVRLRALLALICHQQGNGRWRRHCRAALYALTLPHHERLLTDRDPELGGRFWRLLLQEGIAEQEAAAALQRLGQAHLLHPLLVPPQTAVLRRVAPVLAAIGDETSMPLLVTAVAQTTDRPTKKALQAALTHLENSPPPPLTISLMGGFGLRRGEQVVSAAAFHRPIVLRLLQYFAVHHRQKLSRDRILDALWPDTDPAKSYKTFRSLFSRLRGVLEPHMRTNGPNRYFYSEGDVYQFDPHGHVTVDTVQATTIVQETLQTAVDQPIPPLPDPFLETLDNWQPLLPELAYEEWLLGERERLQTLYLDGCLHAARALLLHNRYTDASAWARRVIQNGPWLEEGYRTLMRAYARQGQPARALKVYQAATIALQQELDMTPSELTTWLAHRLRQGEAI